MEGWSTGAKLGTRATLLLAVSVTLFYTASIDDRINKSASNRSGQFRIHGLQGESSGISWKQPYPRSARKEKGKGTLVPRTPPPAPFTTPPATLLHPFRVPAERDVNYPRSLHIPFYVSSAINRKGESAKGGGWSRTSFCMASLEGHHSHFGGSRCPVVHPLGHSIRPDN